ncbi:MAG: hypothetical protein FJ164_05830 [Gammaproteobacteria bacterium]|nr:hypothetical protein [Gammaproteobacteria bacterium]
MSSLLAGLIACNVDAGAEAPYRSLADARRGADLIVQTLRQSGPEAALALAVRESHLDDPRVQENLTRMKSSFPGHMATLGAPTEAEFTGLDRFMSSFGRYNYLLQCPDGQLRLMFTYRRKTDGWRLNQFYYD